MLIATIEYHSEMHRLSAAHEHHATTRRRGQRVAQASQPLGIIGRVVAAGDIGDPPPAMLQQVLGQRPRGARLRRSLFGCLYAGASRSNVPRISFISR